MSNWVSTCVHNYVKLAIDMYTYAIAYKYNYVIPPMHTRTHTHTHKRPHTHKHPHTHTHSSTILADDSPSKISDSYIVAFKDELTAEQG